ncbi:hypothetical protein ACNKHK_19325 [Shigella flexneri]
MLIWQKGGEFKDTGHVAVITQLPGEQNPYCRQNVLRPLPPGQQ